VTHVERLARLEIHLLLIAAVTRQEHLEIVIAWQDVQALERTVEVIDSASVVAVHEHLRLTWGHLEPQ
jgi:hypothetical protein